MDNNHLHVKNTFIEVGNTDEDGDIASNLPRAFSDQSHVRRSPDALLPVAPVIASIPEESAESLAESSASFQRLDTDELQRLRTMSRPGSVYVFQPAIRPQMIPFPAQLGAPRVVGVPVGDFHWHDESATMGMLEGGKKEFTKLEDDGRLSMVT